MRAAYPHRHRRYHEGGAPRDGRVLGFLYRLGTNLLRVHQRAYHAEAVPGRRGQAAADGRRGRGLPRFHHAPSAHAAELHHRYGLLHLRRGRGGHRDCAVPAGCGRNLACCGRVGGAACRGVLPAHAHPGVVLPHGYGRCPGARPGVFPAWPARPEPGNRDCGSGRGGNRLRGAFVFLRRRRCAGRYPSESGREHLRWHYRRKRLGQIHLGEAAFRRAYGLYRQRALQRRGAARHKPRFAPWPGNPHICLGVHLQGNHPHQPAGGQPQRNRLRPVERAGQVQPG